MNAARQISVWNDDGESVGRHVNVTWTMTDYLLIVREVAQPVTTYYSFRDLSRWEVTE